MSFTESAFSALPVIADANQRDSRPALQSGDILISHRHAGKEKWDNKAYHASTIVIPSGHDSTEVRLYESHPDSHGVRSLPWTVLDDDCTVFRPWGPGSVDAAAAAALKAAALCQARVGYSSHFVGVGRGILCGVGGPKYGDGARERLMKYHGRESGAPKNCVCSEYVVLCYQLALGEAHPYFIRLDAKHTAPWDLEDYLLGKIGVNWMLAGAAKGKSKSLFSF
jgi:hypothetical protein